MKHRTRILSLAAALFSLSACTTAQIDEGLALAKPIAAAAVGAAANAYAAGSGPIAALAFNDIWGGIAALRAGQPVATGAVSPMVGNAIAGAIPAGTSTATTLTALTTAAGLVQTP